MAVQTFIQSAASARSIAQTLLRIDDPRAYTTPRQKRIDAAFTLNPPLNELRAIMEQRSIGEFVRVKNTSGGTWTAPYLLFLDTLKLSAQTSATMTNSPAAGAGVVFLTSATFEVGQIVSISSGGRTDYAIVTAVSAGVSVTVDYIYYAHTTPTITALPAYEATAADADAGLTAEWVTTADIANSAYGWAFAQIESGDFDTSALTVEQLLYLSATAGGYTATDPSTSNPDIAGQVVGVVKKVHASTGRVLWFPGKKRFTRAAITQLPRPVGAAVNCYNWSKFH